MKIENTTKTAGIAVNDAASTSPFGARVCEFPLVYNRVHANQQPHCIKPSGPGGAFDIKRVEKLKKAISQDRFFTDSAKIADGLLETVRDLLPHSSR